METVWSFLKRIESRATTTSSNSTSGHLPKKNKNQDLEKILILPYLLQYYAQ
jgi:hypothetical protein